MAGIRPWLWSVRAECREACILGVPCVTLRDNTERPEILGVKSNVLAGADALRMVENAKRMMQQGMGGRIRLETAEREGLSLSISEIDYGVVPDNGICK